MAVKKSVNIPADKLALYDKLVATHPKAERKGDNNPYTSHNGHMFSFLDFDGVLALRLSDADGEAFLKKYKTPPVISYGVVKKGWVSVPDSLLKKTAELKPYFDKSYEYADSLKAKPTAKKK